MSSAYLLQALWNNHLLSFCAVHSVQPPWLREHCHCMIQCFGTGTTSAALLNSASLPWIYMQVECCCTCRLQRTRLLRQTSRLQVLLRALIPRQLQPHSPPCRIRALWAPQAQAKILAACQHCGPRLAAVHRTSSRRQSLRALTAMPAPSHLPLGGL